MFIKYITSFAHFRQDPLKRKQDPKVIYIRSAYHNNENWLFLTIVVGFENIFCPFRIRELLPPLFQDILRTKLSTKHFMKEAAFATRLQTHKGCQLKNVPTGWATTAYISERSRNSKQLKKYEPLYFSFLGGHTYSTFFDFQLLSEIQATVAHPVGTFLS